MNLLRKRFGQAVRSEILERTIDESTQAALTEKAVKPAMQPKVEVVKFEEGQDLEFKVAFEVLPEISSTTFSDLELTIMKRFILTEQQLGEYVESKKA